jgi:hypothetical protein
MLFLLRTAGPIWQKIFFNVRNSPNKVSRESKIGKVARKIAKFGKNLKCFFYGIFV